MDIITALAICTAGWNGTTELALYQKAQKTVFNHARIAKIKYQQARLAQELEQIHGE